MTRRAPGRWLAALAVLLVTGWIFLGVAPEARAASDDVFDRFDVVAIADAQGYVTVTETIVLRFGSSSGRHGLERTLITREPDGNDYDMVYRIDNISVTSPDNVSTDLNTSEQGTGRETYLRIRVGQSDRTVIAPTATYVLTYRVAGLLRSSGSYDELYWDVTGSSMPAIGAASVRITVPGGAQGVFCSVALPGQRGDCASASIAAGSGEFAAASIPSGQVMTVSVKIGPGLIANNTPIREENADAASARAGLWLLGGVAGLSAVVPFIGWWRVRRKTRDFRYEGMPPGTFPPPGVPVREVPSDPRMEIPVSFAPPQISVAEAGLLIDGETQVRDTTATLVSLAVAGVIQLRTDDEQQVRLVDPDRHTDPIGRLMVKELFGKHGQAGDVVDLGEPGTLSAAHAEVTRKVLDRSTKDGWWVRLPGTGPGVLSAIGGLFFPILTFGIVGGTFFGALLLLALPLVLSIVITAIVVRRKLKRGQRSAVGRALTDQVEGFRTYIATAEAEQLQFEEGEDIFSKYLPWAIMFDLTDRWTKVCQRLVQLGRLSATAPTWYYGNSWDLNTVSWRMNTFDTSVGSSVAAAPSFSESGFGSSGSAFDSGGFSGGGGGFSGGGGGGGGGGSW